MAEIVNLRMARKRTARASKEAEAEHQRALHSLPARTRKQATRESRRAEQQLDGLQREPDKRK
ncbi:MAG: DUF4169 family protein [Rhizobiaceae bacterium]